MLEAIRTASDLDDSMILPLVDDLQNNPDDSIGELLTMRFGLSSQIQDKKIFYSDLMQRLVKITDNDLRLRKKYFDLRVEHHTKLYAELFKDDPNFRKISDA